VCACEPSFSIEEVERIVGFLGYGKPDADVWFIGKEEGIGGTSDPDAAYNLKARAHFDLTMDLYEAHLLLRKDNEPIDFAVRIPRTPVWRYEAQMMLHIDGERNWFDRAIYRAYIQRKLGRQSSDGNTFMTELAPIPSKSASDRRWKDKLRTCHPNLEEKIQDREMKLRELSKTAKKIVCYSLPSATRFAKLLDVEWIQHSDEIFTTQDERCVLTPFLGVGQLRKETFRRLINSGLLNVKKL
jgi:hypothetical protein